MHAPSDPFARHRSSLSRLARALSGLVLMVALGSAGAVAVEPKTATQPNWPCRQIMVPQVSLATIWSGPAIESSNWRSDQAVADLVARLAARRTPLDEAEHAIEDFAKTGGAAKKAKLVAVFAGLFETLNDERTQVMEGLLRFGAKQKELAEKIRAENAQIAPGTSRPPCGQKPTNRPNRGTRFGMGFPDFRRTAKVAHLCVRDRRHSSSKDFSRSPKSSTQS